MTHQARSARAHQPAARPAHVSPRDLLRDAASSVTVKSPQDMADLLRSSSPDQAACFALAAHERASWGFDDETTAFWRTVLDRLSEPHCG